MGQPTIENPLGVLDFAVSDKVYLARYHPLSLRKLSRGKC